ncbi:hypothetical protein THIOM_002917 [Candidatus Thiomargarita nelsonii]|uniref:Uncharacterized protein n=1 Tax=Candidatus Thiomargarita nelsonii TaxID=1003181 RepID=A0A176S037_9GAMM|nr:hypothetical protein THIOM_002917 [Candidatus Thiomargarita nelsonii]
MAGRVFHLLGCHPLFAKYAGGYAICLGDPARLSNTLFTGSIGLLLGSDHFGTDGRRDDFRLFADQQF